MNRTHLQRLRDGTYRVSSAFRATSRDAATHRLAVALALQQAGSPAAANLWSAALLHGLPAPRVTNLPVTLARRKPDPAPLPDRHVVSIDGLAATSIARTVIDLGRCRPLTDAIVAADAALHLGLVRCADLVAVLDECADWPGAEQARAVVELASGRAASALESQSRVVLVQQLALPSPELGAQLSHRVFAPVPMWWPQWRTVGVPADTDDTYDPNDELLPLRRKLRDRELRNLGYRVVPWTWWDLTHDPERLAASVRPAFGSGICAAS